MTAAQLVTTAVLVGGLVAQALLPQLRLIIVGVAACVSWAALHALEGVPSRLLLGDVPWDVVAILVGLGLFAELLAQTRAFSLAAVAASRRAARSPRLLTAGFACGMYLVSGLVNNITALLLVLPVLLVMLRLLGTTRRYVRWTLGALLVACNLGGAATPIGDFPAVLLLGRGAMSFRDYLVAAAPPTALALGLLLVLVLAVRPERGLSSDPLTVRLSVSVMRALHRNVRLDRALLWRLGVILCAMLAGWIAAPPALGPELVCGLGVAAALLVRPALGERLARTRVDVEAVLFLVFLFLMVAAVRRSGALAEAVRVLDGLALPPAGRLTVFLVAAGVLTGIFSAGPSMAALLDVADALARELDPTAVYVGLALSVCAGSSFLLTAATSGPLAQALTERAALRGPAGEPIRFGFAEFLPVGVLSFLLIQSVAVAYGLLRL